MNHRQRTRRLLHSDATYADPLEAVATPGELGKPTVLQAVTARAGLSSMTCADACGLDLRLGPIPRMSHTPKIETQDEPDCQLGHGVRFLPGNTDFRREGKGEGPLVGGRLAAFAGITG